MSPRTRRRSKIRPPCKNRYPLAGLRLQCIRMKHSKLHGVAHNFADSLASGLAFVVPHYVIHTDVYAEAAATAEGFVIVDFLKGTTIGAYPDGELEYAAPLFKVAFPGFCARHGVAHSDFRACLVRFIAGNGGNRYIITVEDQNGRRSSREYVGRQGKRSKAMDEQGRLRPKQIADPEDQSQLG